jgi:hypothetical protein
VRAGHYDGALLLRTAGGTLRQSSQRRALSPGQNITFDWSDVSGAASYTIQIDDHDSFPSPWLVNQTVTASTFQAPPCPRVQCGGSREGTTLPGIRATGRQSVELK